MRVTGIHSEKSHLFENILSENGSFGKLVVGLHCQGLGSLGGAHHSEVRLSEQRGRFLCVGPPQLAGSGGAFVCSPSGRSPGSPAAIPSLHLLPHPNLKCTPFPSTQRKDGQFSLARGY